MSCTLKVDGPCRRTLSFSIERAVVDGEVEARLAAIAGRARFKGFRPGHTPLALVRKTYGKEAAEEARRALMGRAFEEAIREHRLHPVGDPELNLQLLADEGPGPFTFELAVEVAPDFELKDLSSIPVSISLPPVDGRMVEAQIERFRQQSASVQDAPADEPAGEDSVLGVSMTYVVDGTALEPRPDRAVFLKHDLVDAIHVPGAGAAFRGLKVGESAELEAELPPHFEPKEHAGRRAALRALVTGHRKVVVPELTQELIEKAGVKDEAELRERVRQGLEAQREQARGEQVDRAVEDWLVEQHPLPLPERLLAKAIDRRVHEVAHRLMEQQGLSSEDGHAQAEAERPRIEQAVKRSLHASFILARLAREHDLGASVAEGEEQVRSLARSQQQDPEQVVQAARREGWLQDVMATVTESKTRAWLRQRARVEEAAPAVPAA